MVDKECPMCGEFMKLREQELTDRVPGTPIHEPVMFATGVCLAHVR